MSPRTAALVSTPFALDDVHVFARQSTVTGNAQALVRDPALTVVQPETAPVAPAPAAPLPLDQPIGAPTAAESAAVDALFDQAARINGVLLAFALMAVAAVLTVVLTHL